jgi:hypothetical protein
MLTLCRCDVDVESTRQSERFEELSAHAKAIFDAISEQHESIQKAIQAECMKSGDRHVQTVAAIVAKQEEGQYEIIKSVTETSDLIIQTVATNAESIRDIASSESLKSDERHRQATDIIVAKQDETHTEVIQALESLDSGSRTEQEATRQELQQLKQAIIQIQEDISQRDEELRGLLVKLSGAKSSRERRKIQERSNAVTVAICALVTIYESLQV